MPHGTAGLWTTRVELDIPDGVLSAKPEDRAGWAVTVETRSITPYVSHGRTVSTGPAKIIWQAEHPDHGLHNDHYLSFTISMKIGCVFADANTNTVWSDQHTLWWKATQFLSEDDTLDIKANADLTWTGIPEGNDGSWAMAKPKPSPYLFIEQWPKCKEAADSTGGSVDDQGMVWLGTVKKTPNPTELIEEHVTQHILSTVSEQMLDIKEDNDATMASMKADITKLTNDVSAGHNHNHMEFDTLKENLRSSITAEITKAEVSIQERAKDSFASHEELSAEIAALKGAVAHEDSEIHETLAVCGFIMSTVVLAVVLTLVILRLMSPTHVYRAFSDYQPGSGAKTAEMGSL